MPKRDYPEFVGREIQFTNNNKMDRNNVTVIVVDCNYFTTNLLTVNGEVNVNNNDKDSFVIYMCVAGGVVIKYGDSKQEKLIKGETILMPASLKEYQVVSSEDSELLEVYIKG